MDRLTRRRACRDISLAADRSPNITPCVQSLSAVSEDTSNISSPEISPNAHGDGLASRFSDSSGHWIAIDSSALLSQPLAGTHQRPQLSPPCAASYQAVKRAFDLTVAILLLVILTPVFVAVALLIKTTSNGPVLYRGLRTGLHGRPFHMLKFRTMIRDAERLGGTSTGQSDRRVTPVGRVLRAWKLDELPQLLNVIRGEMSLVGPRPEVEEYTRLYQGEELQILSVLPGITDFASIEFADLASHLGTVQPDLVYAREIRPRKNQLRLRYVREQSFHTDMRILLATLRTVLRHGR